MSSSPDPRPRYRPIQPTPEQEEAIASLLEQLGAVVPVEPPAEPDPLSGQGDSMV